MTQSKMAVPSLLLAIAVVALLWPQPARAQLVVNGPTNSLVTVSDTAAATLLGPYFEVDLGNPTGMNTIFSIGNTGAASIVTFNMNPPTVDQNGPTATLAHIVIWSDLGVPVFNFNVYLTGFDVQRLDMRQILNGTLPQTASAGQDPTDTISPKGRNSQDINFASCNGSSYVNNVISTYPKLPPAALTAAQIANLQSSLTGNASAGVGGMCAGANHNDNIARGYITVDTVNNCTSKSPEDAGYISSDITFQTFQLTGEVFYVDQLHAIARGDSMVHVHSAITQNISQDPLVTTPGNYTFYGRYTNWDASDKRQPLPNSFAARFLNGNFTGDPLPTVSAAWGGGTVPAGSTSLVVWRDSKTASQYFACGSLPAPFPLGQEDIAAFDEQEHPQLAGNSLFAFGAAFPLATQVVRVGSAALPVSFNSGWVYLDLSNTINGNANPPIDPAAAQAWVQVIEQNSNGFFSVMHRAQAADSGTKAAHTIVN